MILLVIVAVLVLLGVATRWWGTDSRDGQDWAPSARPAGRRRGYPPGVHPLGRRVH